MGASLLVLTVPIAHAQSSAEAMAQPGDGEPRALPGDFRPRSGHIDRQNRQVIAQAAEYYRQGGTPQITVTGYTDTSGSAAHNLELSQRRAEVVADELVREGVPATDIVTIGRGEEICGCQPRWGPRGPQPAGRDHRAAATAAGAGRLRRHRRRRRWRSPRRSAGTCSPSVPSTGTISGKRTTAARTISSAAKSLTALLPGFLGGVSLKQAILYS